MKKIIRVLFVAFALVLFAGTVNVSAASKTGVTVKFYNNLTGEVVKTETYYKSKSGIQTYKNLGLTGLTVNYLEKTVDEKTYTNIFEGWATEDGTKIGIGADNKTTVDGIDFYATNKSQLSTLNISFEELTENKEITLYGTWSEDIYQPTVVLHVYDNKAYNESSVYVRDNIGKLALTRSNGPIRLDLNQMFVNDSETSYLRYDDKTQIVKLNKNASYYKFVKYVDAKGNEITDGYSNDFIESVSLLETKKVGNNTYTNSLEITFRSAQAAQVTEDIDFNIYVVWEEFTTAILEHEYIDEVSTGSGSWSNVTGGTASYTHTFSDPSKATPKTHYEFLYWKHEASEDDQVDSTKEYKAGDKFTYNLSNKESGWKGKVTTYAYWQPDVTLNLYSDGKLISSVSDFTSVSVGQAPTKYGYNFLGWVDGNGNDVTETTFYAAEAGINPEVREYTLYAKWERIMVEVTVSKVWNDKDDEDEVRPNSVTVELKDGEEVIETVELNEENKWTYTFVVPKYNEESEIVYSISENEIEFYTSEITGSIEEGFVITNTHEVWPKGDTNYEDEVVQTGSTVNSIYVSFIGLTSLGLAITRRKRLN